MKGKKQHNWNFMGNDSDGEGDWCYCDLCDSWTRTGNMKKIFKLIPDMYTRMIREGRITGV